MEAYHLLKKCNETEIKALEETFSFQDFNDSLLIVGNTYRILYSDNFQWKVYFISNEIDKVSLILHPTFGNTKVEIKKAPFEIERIGWGTFDIKYMISFKDGSTFKGVHPLSFEGQGYTKTYSLTELHKIHGKNIEVDIHKIKNSKE